MVSALPVLAKLMWPLSPKESAPPPPLALYVRLRGAGPESETALFTTTLPIACNVSPLALVQPKGALTKMSGACAVVPMVTLPSPRSRVRSLTFKVAFAAVGVHTPPEHWMFLVALVEIVTPGCADGGGSLFNRFKNGRCAGPFRRCSA